jgi:hypothetical protein
MNQTPTKLSKRILESLQARHDTQQWERLMAKLLKRLELDESELKDAKSTYEALANTISINLNIPRVDVDVFPQGSMRTQTTISPRGTANFDLDIVVKLSGSNFSSVDPEKFFAEFGRSLRGNESYTGVPEPKRRCWRLSYPGKSFYFDVTPALADGIGGTGAKLKVRDPETRWSPSNPEEFANWFCQHADLRFPFQTIVQKGLFEARTTVAPLPIEQVGLDDILRRTVQLMKLHRDNMYWSMNEKRKEAMPISVIIVTLATQAFESIWRCRKNEFSSPLEVVLAVVEDMPIYFSNINGVVWVPNPKLPSENFADRWRTDSGARKQEFNQWHRQLETDIEALLSQSESSANEIKIRNVFGVIGVEAWKDSQPRSSVLTGLLASAPSHARANPSAPTNVGSKGTLG